MKHAKLIEKTNTFKKDLFFNILVYSSILIISLIARMYYIVKFTDILQF